MLRISLILAGILMVLASCEKVVDIKLDNASPQYVIEADLLEGQHDFRVRVSRTNGYFGSQSQDRVNDAIVALSDDAGLDTTLQPAGNGWYLLPDFTAVSGKTYRLRVTAGGKTFTASSTMPQRVPLDSLSYEFEQANNFRDAGYEVACFLKDPAGGPDFYRVRTKVNGRELNTPDDLLLFNDKFNNGRVVRVELDPFFQPGDSVMVTLQTMDEQVFDFFSSLRSILGNQSGPAPANPNSNIEGGALGYFGAFAADTRTVILPQ